MLNLVKLSNQSYAYFKKDSTDLKFVFYLDAEDKKIVIDNTVKVNEKERNNNRDRINEN